MTSRDERLLADFEALQALKAASGILDFEAAGEKPERYTIVFRGQGVGREPSAKGDVEYVDLHKIDIRLPFTYPERPPDIRWLTPIFHPNVSFSGFIDLADIGLPWHADLGLDAVCERLWDLARLAYVNPDQPANYSAKNWHEKGCRLPLPVDARPLRNRQAPASQNVIRYQRRGQTREPAVASANSEILFIGEDTPTPTLPAAAAPLVHVPRPARQDDNDDVLYIGDEP